MILRYLDMRFILPYSSIHGRSNDLYDLKVQSDAE
jgi:hypothetical protein